MTDKRTTDEAIANWARIKTQGAPPRPGIHPGGIADKVLRYCRAQPETPGATAHSRIYWTAYRAGQIAKREAGMEYKPPLWISGPRKKLKKKEWIPGEHRKPKVTKLPDQPRFL